MTKRRTVAGRHWLNAGKVKETVIGYLCSRGHYVFTAEGPEEDACQSKNVGAIVVRQVRSPGGWPDEQLREFIEEAEESLGRKLSTWRKCECENFRAGADSTPTPENAWPTPEQLWYQLLEADEWERLDRVGRYIDAAIQRTTAVEVLRDLARDARIRGDVGKEGGVEAWDYLNLYADKIERESVEDKIERSSLGTPEAKALRDSVSDEAVAKVMARVKELEAEPAHTSCPRCFEDVDHEDDHLVGDKDVNCWYECPGDEAPTSIST